MAVLAVVCLAPMALTLSGSQPGRAQARSESPPEAMLTTAHGTLTLTDTVSLSSGPATAVTGTSMVPTADDTPPAAVQGDAPEPPADDAAPPAEPQPAASPAAPSGNLTITGHVFYLDRNGVQQPVKELVEILSATDTSLALAYSDWDGSFSITIANPGQFKVRMWTYYRHSSMAVSALRVVPDGSFNAGEEFALAGNYNASTGLFGPYPDGAHDVGGWRPGDAWSGRYAWWIYTDLLNAFFYPWYCTPYCPAAGSWNPDGGTAEWTYAGTDGDYFDNSKMNLRGDAMNSPSTILRVYGLQVMQNVYGGAAYYPPNDCAALHYIQYISTASCAWAHGWGLFFSMAVRNQGSYTFASGTTVNLETPTWGTVGWDNGEKVEGRVAGYLWDMLDYANDGMDTWRAPYGFAEIWDVVYNQNDNTAAQFYTAWRVRGHSQQWGLVDAYQNTINYFSYRTVLPLIRR